MISREDLDAWRERVRDGWQVTSAARDHPRQAQRPTILALVAVWNEEDIIYALVRHLQSQGVDRVLVLDDRSDDRTAEEAADAGAEVILISTGDAYEEATRASIVGEVVARASLEVGSEVWWVVVDADEFPVGPGPQTIRDVVESAADDVDVVGAHFLGHVPGGSTAYIPRRHPIDYFPLAVWHIDPYCLEGHCKHPLFRLRTPHDLVPGPGQHIVLAADRRLVVEHSQSLLVHHFPVRIREKSERRLRRLLGPGGRYERSPEAWMRWHAGRRLASLEALYSGRYTDVPSGVTPIDEGTGILPKHWLELVEGGLPPAAGQGSVNASTRHEPH